MQKVLDGLQNWATTNNMLLNLKKTKDMWTSFFENSIEPDLLRINDSWLERVTKFKQPGLWQHDKLCWNYHVEQTVKEAGKRSRYFVRECRRANLPDYKYTSWTGTKIRPLLEYASPEFWRVLNEIILRQKRKRLKSIPSLKLTTKKLRIQ